MNLIRGALKRERDGILFSEENEGTIELRLPIAELGAGQAFMGKPVLLGIRPEQISLAESSRTEQYSGSFPAIIDLVETTGGGTNLYLRTGAHSLVCRGGRDVNYGEAGHRVQCHVKLGKVCLFDPISGRRFS